MELEGKQFSHYRLLHVIGTGGMGEVYLAEDIHVRRQVAIKVIKVEAHAEGNGAVASTLRLFLREATAIANLDHPHILPLYDYGEAMLEGTRFAYLVTPYCAQGSLVTWLRKRTQVQQTQPLTLRQVVHLIQQAAKALQYAHEHQVIHQDVKPANFLIRGTAEAEEYPDLLLADFGIARLENATAHSSQHVRGTPMYMAPEQWTGQAVAASDQYALALMAYELLAGAPPFQGTHMNLMYAHLHTNPQPLHKVNPLLPSAVDAVLLHALAKQPEARFSSIAAFAQDFAAAFQGIDEGATLPILAPSPSTLRTPDAPHTGDIRATLAISLEEARSGASRTLTLPGGRRLNIQVPPEARPGQVLVLLGQGETLGPGRVGNLYLTLSLVEVQPQRGLADDDAAERYHKTQDARRVGEAATVTNPPLPRERLQSRRSRKMVPLLVSTLLALLVVSMSILWTTGMINAQHVQATATAQQLTTRTYVITATAPPTPTATLMPTATPTPIATLAPEPPTSVMLRVSASGIPPTTQSELTIPSGTIVTLTVLPDHSLLPFQIFTMGIYATDPYGFSELQYCQYPKTATCSYTVAYSSSERTDYTKGKHTFRAFLGNIGGAILTNSSSITITWV